MSSLIDIPPKRGYVLHKVIKSIASGAQRAARIIGFHTAQKVFVFQVRACDPQAGVSRARDPQAAPPRVDVIGFHYKSLAIDNSAATPDDLYILLVKIRFDETYENSWYFDCGLLEKSKKCALIEAYSETFEDGKSITRVKIDSTCAPRIFHRISRAGNIWKECE